MSDTVSNTKGLSEVNKKCNDLCTSIEKLKLDLLFAVEGVEFKKVDYKSLTMPDNFDIPSRVLFDQKGKAKSELNQLKKELNALNVLASSEFKLDSSKLIDLSEKPAVHEQGMELWEVNSFYHTPISLVLQNLTQLQLDIRIVEAGCLK